MSDAAVRVHILERLVDEGRAPTVAESAEAIGMSENEIEAAYRRLEQGRAIVLAPGTANVWMANPLSAVPTSFRVETERGSRWANCIWDAFGVLAMLALDGRIETSCPDCQDALTFVVADSALELAEAVVHFAVPAARWWDNIGYT